MIRTAAKFAAFAALTVGLTAFIGAQIAKIQLGDTYRLSATFDDVTGLSNGDDVKVAGVKVGQVAGIDTTEDGRAEVRLEIDSDVTVPTDTVAAVRWRNLLGQRVVYLEPGRAEGRLGDGDRIDETRSVVDIGALINELGGLVSAIDPGQLNTLMTAVSEALDGNEAAVTDLLDSAGELLTTLAERQGTIDQLLTDFDTVSRALADRDDQIATMIDNLGRLTETFAGNEELLGSTLTELASYSGSLDQVLTANQGDLESLIASLAEVTDTVDDNIDVIGDQLDHLPGGLSALHEVTNRGEYIVIQALCFSTGPPPCPTPTDLPGLTGPSTVAAGPSALSQLGPLGPDGTSSPETPAAAALEGLLPGGGS